MNFPPSPFRDRGRDVIVSDNRVRGRGTRRTRVSCPQTLQSAKSMAHSDLPSPAPGTPECQAFIYNDQMQPKILPFRPFQFNSRHTLHPPLGVRLAQVNKVLSPPLPAPRKKGQAA